MGQIGSARRRRYPRMRGARLDEGPQRSHARERALLVARQDPPPGVSPDEAAAAVRDVLDTIGDTCPESPPEE
jgi:hypothetical protein